MAGCTDKVFYVYQYIGPDGSPYYIGKGKGNRLNEKHAFTQVPGPEFRILVEVNLSETDALALENYLIRYYGRKIDGGILDNIKINQWAGTAGWKHSANTKQRISDSTMGVKKSEETKQKMRKPKSVEHREKIRQANLGRPYNAERAAKISATLKARYRAAKELING